MMYRKYPAEQLGKVNVIHLRPRGINKLDTKTVLALKEHIYEILYPIRYRNVKNVLQTRYSYFIQCHNIINASCAFIVIA